GGHAGQVAVSCGVLCGAGSNPWCAAHGLSAQGDRLAFFGGIRDDFEVRAVCYGTVCASGCWRALLDVFSQRIGDLGGRWFFIRAAFCGEIRHTGKHAIPGMLPARSEAAATASAETASEESAENCTSAPFSEPSGSMGTPGHTLNVWVAGSSAGRASVSMSGVVAAQRLPATVIAAT